MDKQFLTAVDMLQIASQHAYCAEHLLQHNGEVSIDGTLTIDALLPITTLIHSAFELTLKAYLLHDFRQIRHYKNLFELVELNDYFGLSRHEMQLIGTLSRQYAFHKGADYPLWENRQQMHVFCVKMMGLYVRLQEMMPVELQKDYL